MLICHTVKGKGLDFAEHNAEWHHKAKVRDTDVAAMRNVSDVQLSGQTPVPRAELEKLVQLKPGDVFSREKLAASTKAIGERLGNDGYAFANANAIPNVDKEKRTVAFNIVIDPGRRVYVRRIEVSGNFNHDSSTHPDSDESGYEGDGFVVILPGNSLTLRTTGTTVPTDADSDDDLGIDLTTG